MNKNENSNFKIVGAALVLPLLALLLVGGSTLILAQPQGPGGGSKDRGPMLERIMENLDLSPAQQEELHELLAENRDEHQAQRESAKTVRQELHDQIARRGLQRGGHPAVGGRGCRHRRRGGRESCPDVPGGPTDPHPGTTGRDARDDQDHASLQGRLGWPTSRTSWSRLQVGPWCGRLR